MERQNWLTRYRLSSFVSNWSFGWHPRPTVNIPRRKINNELDPVLELLDRNYQHCYKMSTDAIEDDVSIH